MGANEESRHTNPLLELNAVRIWMTLCRRWEAGEERGLASALDDREGFKEEVVMHVVKDLWSF